MDFEPAMLASVEHLKRDDLDFNIDEIVARMRLTREVKTRMNQKFSGDPLGFRVRQDVEARTTPRRFL